MLRASEHDYRMAGPGKLRGATRTERECFNCDDGTFIRVETELVCDTCSYSPDRSPRMENRPHNLIDQWPVFWKARENYSGFIGPNRVKMVGGFTTAYLDEEGRLSI